MKRVRVNYRPIVLLLPVFAAAICFGIPAHVHSIAGWIISIALGIVFLAYAVQAFVRGALVLHGNALHVHDLTWRTTATHVGTSRRDFAIEPDGLWFSGDGKRVRVSTRLADRAELAALATQLGPEAQEFGDDPGPDAFDRAATWLAMHGPVLCVGLVTILVGIIHAGVFRGHPAGDDLTFHYAESVRIADCLRVGDFDFWNPSANGGYASLYYYQEIPQLLSAIPAAVFGHHLFWFQLTVWLPHVLAPLLAYRGLRLLGCTPWQATVGAFAIGLTNGRSRWGAGNAGTFHVGLYTQTWALAVMPLALGYAVRWIRDREHLAAAIAWSALVALCHPFAGGVLGLGLAISVVAGFVPRLEPARWPSMVGRLLVFVGAFVAVALPAVLDAKITVAKDHTAPGWTLVVGIVLVLTGLALPIVLRGDSRWVVPDAKAIGRELLRTMILGAGMVIATMAFWLPLLVDWSGFGGFPHRVGDEVGPGFYGLGAWFTNGEILDWFDGWRLGVFTWSLPVVIMFVRAGYLRWLWPPSLLFAIYLGAGQKIGKIGSMDLFPAVRVLGSMQILLAMGIGVCMVTLVQRLWTAEPGSPTAKLRRIVLVSVPYVLVLWLLVVVFRGNGTEAPFRIIHRLTRGAVDSKIVIQLFYGFLFGVPLVWFAPALWNMIDDVYAARTAIAAYVAALLVLILIPGTNALVRMVRVMEDKVDNKNNYVDDMAKINDLLADQPQGRKQVGPGAENHWWNLLSWADDRVPSLLQMGGGGLQASPNYDYLWSRRDFALQAWLYDAPYVVFMSSMGGRVPDGDEVAHTENYMIRRLPAPGLVSPVQITGVLPEAKKEAHAKALEWLKGEDPIHDRVLAYAGSGPAGDPPAGKMLRAWHQDSGGNAADIVAEVEAEKPSTFMIRESWHPRWHAYIDGDEVRVRRVTPDFPAVDVPAGKHTIELRFERPWWLLGTWLMWPAVPFGAWYWQRRRRKRQIPEARVVQSGA
jgi:hypothetical protein